MKLKNLKIGFMDYFSYGSLGLSCVTFSIFVGAYLTVYLTDVVGFAAGVVGSAILLLRFTDGIADFVMGYIIDHTHSRFGKARPWIFMGAIGTAISFFFLFNIPSNMSDGGKMVFFVIFYFLLTTVFDTIFILASDAILPMLTNEPKQRNIFGATKQAAAVFGGLMATALSSIYLASAGFEGQSFRNLSLLYGAICLAGGIFASLRLKEQYATLSPEKVEKTPMLKSLKILFSNRYYSLITSISVVIILNNTIVSAVGVYFAKDVMQNPGFYTIFALSMLAPVLLTVGPATALSNKYGKHKVLVISIGICIIGSIISAFAVLSSEVNIPLLIGGNILTGLARGGFNSGNAALNADVSDYSEWRYKMKMEGLIFSGISFGNKLGTGLGGALVGWLLAFGGYNGMMDLQPLAALNVERGMLAFSPIICYALVLVFLIFSNLDPMLPTIRKELTESRQEKYKLN